MNIHTYMLSTLEKSKAKHYEEIVNTVDSMLRDIDELMEDPLFIDNIHGEQELSLDQAVELFNNIRVQFLPAPNIPEFSPAHESGSIDVS
jgi:hypothetical protein|tara:strand:- start:21 stop:290 length:270 start_codon:yes stop_codon:yes gene_type:complete